LFIWRWGAGGGYFTVLGGRSHTTLPEFVKDKHSRTSLEAGISTLARPVSVARFAKRNITVGVIFAQC
jgi:hypothetical protein